MCGLLTWWTFGLFRSLGHRLCKLPVLAGAEWEELEWLVSSPADMDKIRTFDMEAERSPGWRNTKELRWRMQKGELHSWQSILCLGYRKNWKILFKIKASLDHSGPIWIGFGWTTCMNCLAGCPGLEQSAGAHWLVVSFCLRRAEKLVRERTHCPCNLASDRRTPHQRSPGACMGALHLHIFPQSAQFPPSKYNTQPSRTKFTIDTGYGFPMFLPLCCCYLPAFVAGRQPRTLEHWKLWENTFAALDRPWRSWQKNGPNERMAGFVALTGVVSGTVRGFQQPTVHQDLSWCISPWFAIENIGQVWPNELAYWLMFRSLAWLDVILGECLSVFQLHFHHLKPFLESHPSHSYQTHCDYTQEGSMSKIIYSLIIHALHASLCALLTSLIGALHGLRRCRPKSCPEPDAHTATGFSVIQFAARQQKRLR